jgi:hypothetical protein
MRLLFTFLVSLSLLPVSYGQQLISSLTEDWVDSTWQHYFQTSFAYNADQKEAQRTSQSFQSGEWINTVQSVTVYDGEGRIETISDLVWNDNAWNNSLKHTYVYENSSDRVLSVTTSAWIDNQYLDITRITKEYDQLSGLVLHDYLDIYDQLSGNWNHQSSYEYTYNSENRVEQMVYSLWDNLLLWVQERRFTRAYTSSGNIQLNYEEQWVSNEWKNSRMQHYTYGTDGLLMTFVSEDWGDQAEAWVNTLRLEYTYNDDALLYQVFSDDWLAEAWTSHFRTTNVYGTAQLGTEEQTRAMNVFPNPATEQLQIMFEQPATATIVIADMQGKPILSTTSSGVNHTISIHALPAGTYILSIFSEGQMENRRIVKQ